MYKVEDCYTVYSRSRSRCRPNDIGCTSLEAHGKFPTLEIVGASAGQNYKPSPRGRPLI